MLVTVVIHLLERLRRAVKRGASHLFLLSDVMHEAMQDWREAGRKYPFAD